MSQNNHANKGVKSSSHEKGTLIRHMDNLRTAADAMEASRATYSTQYVIDTAYVPKDLEGTEKLLKRFFEDKKITGGLIQLVDTRKDLLDEAIDFLDNPGKGVSRAAYKSAQADLEAIQQNLLTYEKLNEKSEEIVKVVEVDKNGKEVKNENNKLKTTDKKVTSVIENGFANYYQKAKKIMDFKKAFDTVIEYAEGSPLSENELAINLGQLEQKLMIGAPGANTADMKKDDVISDGKIEIGSDEDITLTNKIARETVTKDINIRKGLCYKEAFAKSIEFNNCNIGPNSSSKSEANKDLECLPIHKEFTIAKANCDSHFPMVTISNAIIDQLLKDVGRVYYDKDTLALDYGKTIEAVNNFTATMQHIANVPLQIMPAISYDVGADKVNAQLHAFHQQNVIAVIGYNEDAVGQLLMIGASTDNSTVNA
jgi:hypothetical protein